MRTLTLTLTEAAAYREWSMPIMRFVVSFTTHVGYQSVGEPMNVARFRCEGEAVAYAMFAYSKFPSPRADAVRVYHVTKGRKYIYRAG